MRILLLISILALGGGCLMPIAEIAIATAVDGAISGSTRGERACDAEGVECMSASEARDRERERSARDQPVIARARELTRQAAQAAGAGNCRGVHALQQVVLGLPEVQLEGGVHDTMFLRDPAIVRCLAEHRYRHPSPPGASAI